MKILYDHSIFSMQRFGGISRYFSELMKASQAYYDCSLSCKFSNNLYLDPKNSENGIQDFPRRFELAPRINYFGKGLIDKIVYKISQPLALRELSKANEENKQYSIRSLRASDFDIFHPTYYDDYFLDYLGSRPFVLTVYDMIHEIYPEYFPLSDTTAQLKHKLMGAASHIIAISENTKADIISINKMPPEKISVIYLSASFSNNGELDFHDSTSGLAMNLPEQYILFTGNRNGYKNFYFFARVLSELLQVEKNLFLVCTGSQFSNDEITYLNNIGIANRTICVSANEKELQLIYSNALFFVFPSLYEGFGIPILEAFFCGCPALLSDCSSLPEIGKDAALYFDPKNGRELLRQMRELFANSQLRNELKARGRERGSGFSWESTKRQTAEVYSACAVK